MATKSNKVLSTQDYEMTLDEVGEAMGISRERVRQLQRSALAKVRSAMIARGLGPTALDMGSDGQFLVDALALASDAED